MNPKHSPESEKSPVAAFPNLVGSGLNASPEAIRLAEEQEALYCMRASRRKQDAEARLVEHWAASESERLRMKSLREKVSIAVLALVAVAGAAFVLAGFLVHPLLFPIAVPLLSAIVKPASQVWGHPDSRLGTPASGSDLTRAPP